MTSSLTQNFSELPIYTIHDSNKELIIKISPFGAGVVSMEIETAKGLRQIILTSPNKQDIADMAINTIVGRVANRIGNAKFTLDGIEYQLDANNNGHCLHGGFNGCQGKIWNLEEHQKDLVKLSYICQDDRFPNKLKLEVTYSVNNTVFTVDIAATALGKTIANPTWHGYFNLDGVDANATIYNHHISVNADRYIKVDQLAIAYGVSKQVDGSLYDMREQYQLENMILESREFQSLGGLDHSFILNKKHDIALSLDSADGLLSMDIITNQPTVHLYAGNHLNKRQALNGVYQKHAALAIELHHYINAINIDDWRDAVILEDGETLHNITNFVIRN